MDKKQQIEQLQRQLQQRSEQLLAADHLAGKIIGAIELLNAQVNEEADAPEEKVEEVVAN